ncbi:MAG TPA: hypothetical protein VNF27_15385 [Candidatus Binataceae bacterium]|nr:hypothetical protein [Candidatus Binataceae bacterium]
MAEEKASAINFENIAKVGREYFSLEGAKKFAAWYIETSEKIAKDALDMQARATSWAKETPLAPVFAAQQELGRKFVERSAQAARTIWRLN